jgi:hypothetical protein
MPENLDLTGEDANGKRNGPGQGNTELDLTTDPKEKEATGKPIEKPKLAP